MDFNSLMQGGFLVRLLIDLACVLVLVRGIYYRTYGRADHFLSFFSFNLAIFLIAFVLNSTQLSLGAAFGLFAVFTMLRYRTEGISTNDMTYLFLGIALGLIMAIASLPPAGLAAVGVLLVGFTALLESGLLSRRESRQDVLYDNIKLINAQARAELTADLRERTGLNIHRVEVQQIDLVRDVAALAVYYYAPSRRAKASASARPRASEAVTGPPA